MMLPDEGLLTDKAKCDDRQTADASYRPSAGSERRERLVERSPFLQHPPGVPTFPWVAWLSICHSAKPFMDVHVISNHAV